MKRQGCTLSVKNSKATIKDFVCGYIAGIDIGNSSTEVALARQDETGALTITHSALAETTGIKGTLRNVFGIQEALALVAKARGDQCQRYFAHPH